MKEDFLAVVETKRFLGREFVTWLMQRCEEDGGKLEIDGDPVEITLGDRITLERGQDRSRLTIVGPGDTRPEVGAGLRSGKLADVVRFAITRGERRWELALDGGLLTYDSLRCPKLGERDAAFTDDPRAAFENDLFLRLADVEEAIGIIDRLFADFCRLRGAAAWRKKVLPGLRTWTDTLR